MNNMLINFIFSLLIPLYVAVAFLTLLERKVLGFRQLWLGLNKTSIYGLFQPLETQLNYFLKYGQLIKIQMKYYSYWHLLLYFSNFYYLITFMILLM